MTESLRINRPALNADQRESFDLVDAVLRDREGYDRAEFAATSANKFASEMRSISERSDKALAQRMKARGLDHVPYGRHLIVRDGLKIAIKLLGSLADLDCSPHSVFPPAYDPATDEATPADRADVEMDAFNAVHPMPAAHAATDDDPDMAHVPHVTTSAG